MNNKKERKQQEQQRHSNSEIKWGIGRQNKTLATAKFHFFERGNEERERV